MTTQRAVRLPWLAPAAAVLVVALLVEHDALADLWDWLGWWHWALLALAAAAVTGGVAALAAAAASPRVDPALLQRLEDERAAADEELVRARALTQHQLELQVSRCLRRDGWHDAHVDGAGSDGSLVLAHHGTAVLLAACKRGPARVVAHDVQVLAAARGAHPGAVAVYLTTGDYAESALAAARSLGVVPMDGEDLGRWLALGPAAWPATAPTAR